MPSKKPPDGLGQGDETGYSQPPYSLRQALEPMPPAEAEAFDWVIAKLAALDPEADLSALCEAGVDEGCFYLGPQGELHVSPDAPSCFPADEGDDQGEDKP